jgi:hypothetical protein
MIRVGCGSGRILSKFVRDPIRETVRNPCEFRKTRSEGCTAGRHAVNGDEMVASFRVRPEWAEKMPTSRFF